MVGAIPPGSLPVDKSRRHRGAAPARAVARPAAPGRSQEITLGTGLAMIGTTLAREWRRQHREDGYWTPITNGDPVSPELIFDSDGDCIVGFVPTP